MAWLGIVFALLTVAQLVLPTSDAASRALNWAIWVIWGLFVMDFLAKFSLAPRKLHFLRTHWRPCCASSRPRCGSPASCGCSGWDGHSQRYERPAASRGQVVSFAAGWPTWPAAPL